MRLRAPLLLVLLCAACATTPPVPTSAPAPSPSPSTTPAAVVPSPQAFASPAPAPSTPPARSPWAAGCPAALAAQLASTGGGGQLITVEAPTYGSTLGTLTAWVRTGPCWTVAFGPWQARLGVHGVSDHHREGDGTTPTGLYGFGATVYGLAADPGVHFAYHHLVCGDWWDEDPSSATYNTFQHVACGAAPPFGGGSEALWQATTAYQTFAVVDYNAHPVVAGAGSAVFLHDDLGHGTAGCVSLPAAELLSVLRWLDPARSPRIVVGTSAEIRRF